MTRETKIGLLVGLAFIIVIGILLSDHLTSSTEPPQAALAGAGSNVRQAVASPGAIAPQLQPVSAPSNAAPNNPVPTRDELTPGPNPMTIVKVGPASSGAAQRVMTTPAQGTAQVLANDQPDQPQQQVAGNDAPITREPAQSGALNNPITDVAKQHGEELELVDQNGRAVHGNLPGKTGVAEYKAQAGDSLSKMAQKMMGANNPANRNAIIAANPSLKSDPNKVIVGKTYKIPTSPQTTDAAMANNVPEAAATPAQTADTKSSKPVAEVALYEVKSGDSLWKIATEQCGNARAVAALKELNKDVLGGSDHDQVMVGTKIRLPAKSVAQAN